MNELSVSIDEMLEEVAIAMAEGNNQRAKELLPQIIRSGDETQQLMAESYLMQLDLLLEMEDESNVAGQLFSNSGVQDEGFVQESAVQLDELIDNSDDSSVSGELFSQGEDTRVAQLISDDSDDNEHDEAVSVNEERVVEEKVEASPLSFSSVAAESAIEDVVEEAELEVAETESEDFMSKYFSDDFGSGSSEAAPPFAAVASEVVHNSPAQESAVQNIAGQESAIQEPVVQEMVAVANSYQEKQQEFSQIQPKEYEVNAEVDKEEQIDEIANLSSEVRSSSFSERQAVDTAYVGIAEIDAPSSEIDEEELNLALEQVAILVEEGDLETADMLFKTVIGQVPHKLDIVSEEVVKTSEEVVKTSEEVVEASSEMVEDSGREDDVSEGVVAIADSELPKLSEPLLSESEPAVSGDSDFASESAFETVIEQSDSGVESQANQLVEQFQQQYAGSELWSSSSVTLEADDSMLNNSESFLADDSLLAPSSVLDSFSFDSAALSPDEEVVTTTALEQRQGVFIGGLGLMIKFADGNELMELPKYYQVPNSPSWLVGLTNVHGLVIPVFDLAKFFNLESQNDAEHPMLLILFSGDDAIGVLIDSLPSRLFYDESKRMASNTTPPQLKGHVYASYLINDRLWYDLDSKSLSSALEASMR